jgi:hypothetical protein
MIVYRVGVSIQNNRGRNRTTRLRNRAGELYMRPDFSCFGSVHNIVDTRLSFVLVAITRRTCSH